MSFVFSRRFYILLALGFVPLSLAWALPWLTYVVFAFDVVLAATAIGDSLLSRRSLDDVGLRRAFGSRFAIGDAVRVSLELENPTSAAIRVRVKDEYPPEMLLDEGREA